MGYKKIFKRVLNSKMLTTIIAGNMKYNQLLKILGVISVFPDETKNLSIVDSEEMVVGWMGIWLG